MYSKSAEKNLQTSVCCWYCVDACRRPEGKFKRKQTPHDEALQILRPQMDNPPAPQVQTFTRMQSAGIHTHTSIVEISHVEEIFLFRPAETSWCPLTIYVCIERGRIYTHQGHEDESTQTSSPHTSSRYSVTQALTSRGALLFGISPKLSMLFVRCHAYNLAKENHEFKHFDN